jgi:hypothetical protein
VFLSFENLKPKCLRELVPERRSFLELLFLLRADLSLFGFASAFGFGESFIPPLFPLFLLFFLDPLSAEVSRGIQQTPSTGVNMPEAQP